MEWVSLATVRELSAVEQTLAGIFLPIELTTAAQVIMSTRGPKPGRMANIKKDGTAPWQILVATREAMIAKNSFYRRN